MSPNILPTGTSGREERIVIIPATAAPGKTTDSITSIKEGLYGREGKGRPAVWGTEWIKFLAALAVLHLVEKKKRMNCIRMK